MCFKMSSFDVTKWGAILSLLLLATNGETPRDRKDSEVWLTDLIDYDYMGDAPAAGSDFCPPVPSVLPSGSCEQSACSSDRACAEADGKCCYNGCIYTCLYQVGPPGYFDWSKEPRRRLSSGRSWLINSPESIIEVESCSTTPADADEDPLLCPHGYLCSIEDQGDPKKGIPNRGHCVKERDDSSNTEEELSTLRPPLLLAKLQERMRKERVCEEHDGLLILEGAHVDRDGKHCICRHGKLACKDMQGQRSDRHIVKQKLEQ